MNKIALLTFVAALQLAGCAAPDSTALFVTKTSLSLFDVDGTPASVTIAYDRKEGYLGPRYENGAVPPVIAKIESNGNLWGRELRQYYATGNAAMTLAGRTVTAGNAVAADKMIGRSKPMFFGTETTLGIKIGFTTQVPDSFTFGYKRKEYSLIPLGSNAAAQPNEDLREHYYPSVIGVFSTDFVASSGAAVANRGNTQFGLTQFFATGAAADELAKNDRLGNDFRGFAQDAVSALKESSRHKQDIVLSLLRCFARVDNANLADVYKSAASLGLHGGTNPYPDILKEANPQRSRANYTTVMALVPPEPPELLGRLEGHRVFVCEHVKKI